MWFFDCLLRLYPAGFRAEYSLTLRQSFTDEWLAAPATSARLRLCVQSLCEFLLVWPQIAGAEFAQDARYCWRSWRSRTGVTTLAILSLALAIGVSTGVFSILSATLYRSLPFSKPAELVDLHLHFGPVFAGQAAFQQWQSSSTYLSGATVMMIGDFNLTRSPAAIRIKLAEVSANFFTLLGTPIYRGRGFAPEEEILGKGDVAVLSHALFEQAYGGDLRVLNQKILINGHPLIVIGIAPPAFDYPDHVALWTPTVFDSGRLPKANASFLNVTGRLKPQLSIAQANHAFDAEVASRPKAVDMGSGPDAKPQLIPLRNTLVGPVAQSTWVLFTGICSVLLIACANMASLLLTRYAERQREFQIRSFLGAGVARIGQQILTECVLLACASGLLGLTVAFLTVQIAIHFYPPVFAFQTYEILDTQVLLFAFLLSLFCGLCFGAIPALIRKQSAARRINAFRHTLLGLQLCLTVVLLIASGSIGQALLGLYATDIGFQTKSVVTATVSLAGTPNASKTASIAYLDTALERLRALPGVSDVGAIDFLPLSTRSFFGGFYRVQTKTEPEAAIHIASTPGFFHAIGASIVAGRDFLPSDTTASAPIAIVNESYAKLDGGLRGVLGRKLRAVPKDDKAPTIVGVLRDIYFVGPQNEMMPQIYRPLAQGSATFFTIAVRHEQNANPARQIAAALQALAPDVPIYDVLPFERRLEQSLARPNFYTIVLVFFGAFSLLLTLVNGYSLCANTIEQRTRELAIRMAVGAQAQQVRTMILRQMFPAMAIGLAAGFVIAPWATTLLTHLIETIAPARWPARLLPIAALAGIATLAIWLKTRRILRLAPSTALRAE